MVYRIQARAEQKNGKLKLVQCLRYGVLAVGCAWIVGRLAEVPKEHSLLISVLVGVVCALFVYVVLTRLSRERQMQGDWFLTVTDAGLMVERPQQGTVSYMAWNLVENVFLKNKLLFVKLGNGLTFLFPTAGMNPERAQELYENCVKYAGTTVPLEKQVQPPVELLSVPALPCAAGAAARQEIADELVRLKAPYLPWMVILGVALVMSGLVVMATSWMMVGETNFTVELLAAVYAVLGICYYLHPGWSLRKWVRHHDESFAYIHQGRMLVHTPGVTWSLMPLSMLSRAKAFRHSYVYIASSGGMVGISRSVEPPAALPQPVPVSRWRVWCAVAVSSVLVPALVALGMWGWIQSDHAEDVVLDEAGEQGCALVAYVQEFLPPRDFPGAIYWSTILDQEDGTRMLLVLWENGMELKMPLPEEAPVAPVAESDTSE